VHFIAKGVCVAFWSFDEGFGGVVLAFAVFLISHSLPALPKVRPRLVSLLGEPVYLAIYSAMSLATLAWLVVATLSAPYVELWGFHPETRWVPLLVMPLAMILFVAGATSPNPLSVGPTAKGFDPARPGIVAITRHPVLLACALWSGVHMVPNGDVRAVLLFGGLCLFSLLGMPLYDRRRAKAMGRDAWRRLAAPTATLPFLALATGRTRLGGWGGLAWRAALGLVLYAVVLCFHGAMFGLSPLD
jgi:uncharacterized membrane protein